MKRTSLAAIRSLALFSTAAIAMLPAHVMAQTDDEKTAAASEEEAKKDDIVVTGTLLRGVTPVGSNAITLGAERMQETGAQTANELLGSIPQVTNYFNRVPGSDLSIAINQIQIARPNLRNISPNNAASSATLILVDGHRVATAGVNQASVDPDLIPSSGIQRVEVVTEGGSSLYGTDAVAGVINFITRKRFDGVEVGGHYGFADNYWQWDAHATVGKDWGSGSLWASYNVNKNDALFGRDRDYIRNVNYATLPYVGRDLDCATSNVAYGTIINADPSRTVRNGGTVPNPARTCDNSENNSFIPSSQRHGGIVGFSQELDENTSVDMRAYYSIRKTLQTSDLSGAVAIGPNNAYASQLPAGVPTTFVVGPTILFGFPSTNVVQVNFNLSPLLGVSAGEKFTRIRQYGWNSEIKHDLNENWQVRGLVNWGESNTRYGLGQISQARLNAAGAPAAGATTANSFNPFNVTANNSALIADLIDSEIGGETKDSMVNLRGIAEGKLFELPGGDVRVAVGYEFLNDSLSRRFSSDVRRGALSGMAFTRYNRSVHSGFGEIQLPLISDGEGGSMLNVSASARYDDYSDFGGTFNPKFGATFKPIKGITLRSNWGTSFTAPTPLDQLGSLSNFTSFNTFVAFARPGETAPAGGGTAAVQGSLPGLQPQTAKTWSVGMDFDMIPGLKLSANYYNVHFQDILRSPFSNTPFTDYPANYQTKVTGFTPAEVAAFFGNTAGAATTIAAIGSNIVYEMVDFRTGNFGILDTAGVDVSANYNMETGFGSFDFGVNANVPTNRKAQISSSSAVVDELLLNNSKLNLTATVGTTIGGFRAQASVYHSGGYDITPLTAIAVPQSSVGSFSTVNLFFKYDVPSSSGILKDLSFTANVNNVFDTNPPELRRNNNNELGFANGSTLGRLVQFGVNKKF
jgi:iron complex outermembrane recepter protein